MSDALFSASGLAARKATRREQIQRNGFFGLVLEALHHSRRLQAERTIRRYQHLIDKRWLPFDQPSHHGERDNVAQ
jgi:hypothetical protein